MSSNYAWKSNASLAAKNVYHQQIVLIGKKTRWRQGLSETSLKIDDQGIQKPKFYMSTQSFKCNLFPKLESVNCCTLYYEWNSSIKRFPIYQCRLLYSHILWLSSTFKVIAKVSSNFKVIAKVSSEDDSVRCDGIT